MFLWWAWYPGTSINLPSPLLPLLLLWPGSLLVDVLNLCSACVRRSSCGLLRPLVATSAAAAATAEGGQRLNWPGSQQVDEGEQRLNWPGSLQVVELLFTSPWWSSSLLTGGAVFTPGGAAYFTYAIIRSAFPCRRHRSAVPAPPPPSVGVSSLSGSLSSGSAAGEVAVGVGSTLCLLPR